MNSHNKKPEMIFSCPLPYDRYDKILLAHGGGGKLSNDLLESLIVPHLSNPYLNQNHDGAIFQINDQRLAFTTDSYVINPIFFPGGDIGELAVNGTVNDLAMCGAKPLFLTLGLIIEEGLPMNDLNRIVSSITKAADKAGVLIVSGDTKVVDRGKGDKIFINTSGIGLVAENRNIAPTNCSAGDKIILSGTIAEHGLAIIAARDGLDFKTTIVSDTQPLNDLVEKMFSVSHNIHVLRDPTRGGIASALNEIAKSADVGMLIQENAIPVREEVAALCEILGFDPLYVANEGKLLAFVSAADAEIILSAMRQHPSGRDSAIIGEVTVEHPKKVIMKNLMRTSRVIDMLTGEQLPRIC
jgi:hydrogenase expression/formation protein HypE